MYEFYKVKSGMNYQEFKHPYFRRGHYEDLVLIKRKSLNKCHASVTKPAIEEVSEESDNVPDKLDAVRKSLDIVTAQNKELIEANRKMIAKLYNFKEECESKIKKLFFVFIVLVNSGDEALFAALKKPLEQLNVDISGLSQKSQGQDVLKFIEVLCQKLLAQDFDHAKLVDNLVSILFAYFASKGSSVKKEDFAWADNNGLIENFSVSLFNTESSFAFPEPIQAQYDCPPIRVSVPREGPDRVYLFRETTNQNMFQSPDKHNEINFDEINAHDDHGNLFIQRREEDSFYMSGANSVLMLSPFKRNI